MRLCCSSWLCTTNVNVEHLELQHWPTTGSLTPLHQHFPLLRTLNCAPAFAASPEEPQPYTSRLAALADDLSHLHHLHSLTLGASQGSSRSDIANPWASSLTLPANLSQLTGLRHLHLRVSSINMGGMRPRFTKLPLMEPSFPHLSGLRSLHIERLKYPWLAANLAALTGLTAFSVSLNGMQLFGVPEADLLGLSAVLAALAPSAHHLSLRGAHMRQEVLTQLSTLKQLTSLDLTDNW